MKLKNVFLLYRIRSAMAGNQIIYWLTRVKLLNRVFTDKLYTVEDGKLALSMMVSLYRVVRALAGKALYLAIIWLLPLGLSDVETFSKDGFALSVWMFFWLSFVAGTMLQPVSMEPSQLKYTCVRQMGMNAAEYQNTEMFTHHLAAFAGFTPFLMLWGGMTGTGVLQGLLLSLALACVRILAEWFHLELYRRFHVMLSGKVLYTLGLIVLCLALAYAPMPFGMVPDFSKGLLHPVTLVVLVVLAAVCARAIFRYPCHYALILTTCQGDKLPGQAQKKTVQQKQFDQVKLKDSDLDTKADFSHLHGWNYLQAIFFRRHRRMLLKPVFIAMAILAAVTVVGCGLLMWMGRDEDVMELFGMVTQALPLCVFLLYSIDNFIGERICKAMFYNCDLALLRYGWYRERDAILKNFLLRWKMLCGVNLMLSGTVCAMFILLTVVAGGRPAMGEFILFLLALLSLGVFFATHSLALYYLFQPYTSDLDTQNPLFKIFSIGMYLVCWLAMQVHAAPTWFALAVFAVTVGYSVVMLALVLRRAPKTFRVK